VLIFVLVWGSFCVFCKGPDGGGSGGVLFTSYKSTFIDLIFVVVWGQAMTGEARVTWIEHHLPCRIILHKASQSF
jgi:hypothetical protein